MNDKEELLNEHIKLMEQAELHPDLAACFSEDEGLPMVRHPLVYSVPHSPVFNARLNEMYEHKKKKLSLAMTEENWSLYLILHERPYRLDAFLDIADMMTPEDYWSHLSYVYTDSENIYQSARKWRRLLGQEKVGREHMMDEDERDALQTLPDTLTIYRGETQNSQLIHALSWTLDKNKAVWFSERNATFRKDEPRVLKLQISKNRVIAYIRGRGEEEIIFLPNTDEDVPEVTLLT